MSDILLPLHSGQILTLTIDEVGGKGDGIARVNNHLIFVPLTCAQDIVQVEVISVGKDFSRGRLLEVIEPSPQREGTICPHFGRCGGCQLQHIAAESYYTLKQNILVQAVQKCGGDISSVTEIFPVAQGQRRRVEYKVAVNKGVVSIGFYFSSSHDVVDISDCPVTDKVLVEWIEPLRSHIATLKKKGNVSLINMTHAVNGVDILITVRSPLHSADRKSWVDFASHHGAIIRLSIIEQGANSIAEVLYSGDVIMNFSDVEVMLPIGSFLQATGQGQEIITQHVVDHLGLCNSVVDLYCGCGTYSFPLAQKGIRVHGYEGSDPMVRAMHNAARRGGFDHLLTTAVRDLFDNPLSKDELSAYDGVVINPPRNGAEPQTKQLAISNVSTVVMVSCNPATFSRDAGHLIRGGYKLITAIPIDQFLYTAHLELVAVFQR